MCIRDRQQALDRPAGRNARRKWCEDPEAQHGAGGQQSCLPRRQPEIVADVNEERWQAREHDPEIQAGEDDRGEQNPGR